MFQLAVKAGQAIFGSKKKKEQKAKERELAAYQQYLYEQYLAELQQQQPIQQLQEQQQEEDDRSERQHPQQKQPKPQQQRQQQRDPYYYYQEPGDHRQVEVMMEEPRAGVYGSYPGQGQAVVPRQAPGTFVRVASFTQRHQGRPMPPNMMGAFPGYPTMEPPKKDEKNPKKRRRTCAEEFKTVCALIAFCVSIIVKGVAYSNSHWSNSDQVDVYKNLEKFPIMTQFLDRTNGNYQSDCDDQKCKIFFANYNAQRTVNELLGKPPPPLSGNYARGANSRCEQIENGKGADSSSILSSVTGAAKYEKCAVDKEREINDFKTVRVLLIVSMVADGVAILSWVVTFIRDAAQLTGRAALAVAALFGFISTLLTALALGMFAQAIDIFIDSSISLGWPFYIVLVAAILTFATTILAAITLYQGRQREKKKEKERFETQISVIEYAQRGRGGPGSFEEYQRYMQMRYQQQNQLAPPDSQQPNRAISPPQQQQQHEEAEVSHHRQPQPQTQYNDDEGSSSGNYNKSKEDLAGKNKNKPSQFDSSRDRLDRAGDRSRDHSRDRDDEGGSQNFRRGDPGLKSGGRGPFQAM